MAHNPPGDLSNTESDNRSGGSEATSDEQLCLPTAADNHQAVQRIVNRLSTQHQHPAPPMNKCQVHCSAVTHRSCGIMFETQPYDCLQSISCVPAIKQHKRLLHVPAASCPCNLVNHLASLCWQDTSTTSHPWLYMHGRSAKHHHILIHSPCHYNPTMSRSAQQVYTKVAFPCLQKHLHCAPTFVQPNNLRNPWHVSRDPNTTGTTPTHEMPKPIDKSNV
jgi:hypothetical protein